MTAALTEDGATTEDVKLTQATAGWQSTIELPKDLEGRESDPTAKGTATVAYADGKVSVTYK